jgi:excinuclease UvrABC nuclease subunit
MFLDEPRRIESGNDLSKLDEAIEALADEPAVFLIWLREGAPYLARTGMLKRRLKRLLAPRDSPGRLLNLRALAVRVDYWPAASRLASNLTFYEAARTHFPDNYPKLIKLRPAAYLRLMLSDPYPRFQTTTRIFGSRDFYYGPFRTRADAEEFERQCLDLFQIRRCTEDLAPSPDHPGCIYGEMNLCLRPCQQAVTVEEYESETARAVEFLSTSGRSMLDVVQSARDRLSEEMEYEAAAREHSRLEKLQQMLRMRGELVAQIDKLSGVAVQASHEPQTVELWFMLGGGWLPPVRFALSIGGQMVPLDRRLRDVTVSLHPAQVTRKDREEHLALLARWYYSTWRDGEWLGFENLETLPYRRLVRAISKTAKA